MGIEAKEDIAGMPAVPLMLSLVLVALVCFRRSQAKHRAPAPSLRSVGGQSQTTYTAVRGVSQPRFEPVGNWEGLVDLNLLLD